MVDISAIEAFYHELARETEILAHFKCFFVDVFGREILSDAAIISVREFRRVDLVIEEVVNVYVVHVTLNTFQISVLRLLLLLRSLTIIWLSANAVTINPAIVTSVIRLGDSLHTDRIRICLIIFLVL